MELNSSEITKIKKMKKNEEAKTTEEAVNDSNSNFKM